ncbi:hypothetical protein DERP_013831 [Dermatophagoides pteronyssinus]|uniref:Uncharacterized protein n=1 Tax=Dermatophagoides pteronyssinus TaxID=6956 RepID=A0ABQ8JCP3_DERPT|nr:hypothetical protein DERP_013831 [Dermatophagoides pteronyssinus]
MGSEFLGRKQQQQQRHQRRNSGNDLIDVDKTMMFINNNNVDDNIGLANEFIIPKSIRKSSIDHHGYNNNNNKNKKIKSMIQSLPMKFQYYTKGSEFLGGPGR